MIQSDIVRGPVRGYIWALDVAAAGNGKVTFATDFPSAIAALGATQEERVKFWKNRFVSVRAVGETVTVALAAEDTPTLDPAATGSSNRVGVTLVDGQQYDFWIGDANYLLISNGGAADARIEIWPTSEHA